MSSSEFNLPVPIDVHNPLFFNRNTQNPTRSRHPSWHRASDLFLIVGELERCARVYITFNRIQSYVFSLSRIQNIQISTGSQEGPHLISVGTEYIFQLTIKLSEISPVVGLCRHYIVFCRVYPLRYRHHSQLRTEPAFAKDQIRKEICGSLLINSAVFIQRSGSSDLQFHNRILNSTIQPEILRKYLSNRYDLPGFLAYWITRVIHSVIVQSICSYLGQTLNFSKLLLSDPDVANNCRFVRTRRNFPPDMCIVPQNKGNVPELL